MPKYPILIEGLDILNTQVVQERQKLNSKKVMGITVNGKYLLKKGRKKKTKIRGLSSASELIDKKIKIFHLICIK